MLRVAYLVATVLTVLVAVRFWPDGVSSRLLSPPELERLVGEIVPDRKCTPPHGFSCEMCQAFGSVWAMCSQANVVGDCNEVASQECFYGWLTCGKLMLCTYGSPGGICSQCSTQSTECDFPGCSL